MTAFLEIILDQNDAYWIRWNKRMVESSESTAYSEVILILSRWSSARSSMMQNKLQFRAFELRAGSFLSLKFRQGRQGIRSLA